MSNVVSSGARAAPASTPRKVAILDATLGTLSKNLPAILAGLGLVVLWQVVIWIFKIPTFMAPSPADVVLAFRDNAATLWRNFLPTLLEATLGFLFGNLVAILLAVWFAHSTTAEKAFYPIAVFIKAIPIIALAPILVLIFGNGLAPKIIIAGLICFFPTLVNMVQGLRAASPAMLDLMRVLSATNTEILWKVRFPSSLPFLFAALKIAATSSVMGAIVAEWIGSSFGLGALIIEATYNFRSPLLYATVVIAALLAVVLFALVSIVEAKVVRWKPAGSH
ncbi:ABC transporter permease (plasmid) [Rhizobium ruizarguesonis]|uniref:ABC transporter permease n=1 Tax=Rhizobium ruizarguesonis TaxID=2081791 RepID=UPI0010325410|nr:ABC transporter permease [Rhizobium ruizarguesonis]MBY5841876.1 ABC transporter permease [Rhizobium leguminosarum]TCA29014.1 ABC transporter permease [Rhizobium leguminosarum bv. viciae]NEH88561.1 ABC transporter permease subunit [Rhizobium ruizarguesonis]NEI12983.1 ABC transporter permease subunit [Rhizobium ruizarguesonis]NEJ55903.1 ABC transporter permease subunit [Rhizobium ruizarguesonis]